MRILTILVAVLLAGCTAPSAHLRMREADAGFSTGTFAGLDAELARAVAAGEVPGAVLAVAKNGRLVYEHAVGVRDASGAPMKPDTVFDVASLTKPVATACATAILMCDNELWDSDETGGATVGELLIHQSMLPQYARWEDLEPYRREGLSPAGVVAEWMAAGEPARYRHPYSNLGYVALAGEVEKRTNRPMEALLRERVWGPLGMANTTFRPTTLVGATFAQTSLDTAPGQAFDPLADWIAKRFPGHDPGHSGLFSTARDLTVFCQTLLNAEDSDIHGMECIARTMTRTPAIPLEESGTGVAQFGESARSRAFNTLGSRIDGPFHFHTGYTGCMIWMNAKTNVSVVLMTNGSLTGPDGWTALRDTVLGTVNEGTLRPRGEELYDPRIYTPPGTAGEAVDFRQ